MTATKFSWAIGLLGAAASYGCSQTQSSVTPQPRLSVQGSSSVQQSHASAPELKLSPSVLKRLPSVEDVGDTVQPVYQSLAAFLREFSGEYYEGDGLGYNLRLTIHPNGQFSTVRSGCLGVYDQVAGTIEADDGGIVLHTQDDTSQLNGLRLHPVLWGQRHYLVDADQMLDFCNEVNRGSEPRQGPHGMHLLKDGDHLLPVAGLPSVPDQWQHLLLSGPVRGEIVHVRQDRTAAASLGTADGISEGMVLYTARSPYLFKVLSVSQHECVVGPYYPVVELGCEIRPGDEVSSRMLESDPTK